MAQNSIQRIRDRAFIGLNSIRILNISGNSIRQIAVDTFDSASLQVLDLSLNNLESLRPNTFANLQGLDILNISGNSLSELDAAIFNGLSSLTSLKVAQNDLKTLQEGTFATMPLLERLDLTGNSLQTFSGNVFGDTQLPLRLLFLRNNNLAEIEREAFSRMPNLEFLTVAHNELKSFDATLFTNLSNLRKFHMHHNLVEEIPVSMLNDISSVQELLIDHNRLTFLPESEREFTNLQKLTVEGNPWQCPCLTEIFTLITTRRIDYRATDNPYYAGSRPICVVTSSDACVKDLQEATQLGIVEKYQSGLNRKIKIGII